MAASVLHGVLAYAPDAVTVALAELLPPGMVLAVEEGARFRAELAAGRPRIALCAAPPADEALVADVLAERHRRHTLRAIHLSPPEAVADRLRALELGFDDALPTTVSPLELAGRIALLVDRARARSANGNTIQVWDDHEIDLVAHELRRDGEVVHLRPKEFSLLALLAAHPGRVYTRRQLLDRVWGAEHVVGVRTVDVHVRWLRSKVEPESERPVRIVTVRGIGYRLDDPHR